MLYNFLGIFGIVYYNFFQLVNNNLHYSFCSISHIYILYIFGFLLFDNFVLFHNHFLIYLSLFHSLLLHLFLLLFLFCLNPLNFRITHYLFLQNCIYLISLINRNREKYPLHFLLYLNIYLIN